MNLYRPECELIFRIHADDHCCSSDRSLTDNVKASPREVILPSIAPRMKKLRDSFRVLIDACQVRAFVKIAVNTSERQIVEFVRTAVKPGNDMLDVKNREWRIVLVEFAVFATAASPISNGGSRRRVHRLRLPSHLPRLTSQNCDEFVRPNVTFVLCFFGDTQFAFRGFSCQHFDARLQFSRRAEAQDCIEVVPQYDLKHWTNSAFKCSRFRALRHGCHSTSTARSCK